MVNETLELLRAIFGLLLSLGGLAFGFSKFMRWIGRDRRDARNDSIRWEIAAFKENIEGLKQNNERLKEENARCWAHNQRVAEEHEVECEEKEEEEQRLRAKLQDCEERLEVRRKREYDLGNQLTVAQLMLSEYQQKYGHLGGK